MSEPWMEDFEWLQLRHMLKDSFRRKELPDLEAILYLVGIQELGRIKEEFTKEEKQDLIHIAVCSLLSQDGYFRWVGRDDEGWPHYEQSRLLKTISIEEQEALLKTKLLQYFSKLIKQNNEDE